MYQRWTPLYVGSQPSAGQYPLSSTIMAAVMKFAAVLAVVLPVCLAAPPVVRAAAPTVTISEPQATIIGLAGAVEEFPGIPFAQPPVKSLRLKPPQPLTAPYGTYKATQNQQACPQFLFSSELNDAIPTSALGQLLNTPLFQKALNAGEDCLYLNVHRPAGTKAGDKLPVLFWIFGGGFVSSPNIGIDLYGSESTVC
jgi:hypothetical protein